MSPLDYLKRHCIISSRRMAHCKKIFVRQDKDKDSQINRQVCYYTAAMSSIQNLDPGHGLVGQPGM